MDLRTDKIRELTERYLPDSSYFVVDVKLSGKKGYEKVAVLVDGDDGIAIDVCAEIARSLSEALDSTNMFDESYTLEVSSPGLDYPLSSERQYIKNLGRKLRIDMISGDIIKGELLETRGAGITLMMDKGKKQDRQSLFIPFTDIKKSKVLVTFK